MTTDLNTLLTGLYVRIDDYLAGRARDRTPSAADRRRVAHLGRGAGAARRALRGPLAAVRARGTARCVPVPARAVRLQQAAAGRVAAAQAADPGAGRGHRPVGRSGLGGRLHPGGVRPVPADRAALGPGRLGRLRLLRLPFALLLGAAAAPGLHPRRAAGHLGAGRPQARRARRCSWPCWTPTPTCSPTGPGLLLIADKGYSRPNFETVPGTRRGVDTAAPFLRNRQPRPGEQLLKPIRQLIESVNDTLKGQLDLELHGGRTLEGVDRPHRPAPPRPYRRHLAQPRHRPARHTITDRLRPLTVRTYSSRRRGC